MKCYENTIAQLEIELNSGREGGRRERSLHREEAEQASRQPHQQMQRGEGRITSTKLATTTYKATTKIQARTRDDLR